MGAEKILGKDPKPGYMANLVVTDGNYFDARCEILFDLTQEKEKYITDRHKPIIAGKWELEIDKNTYDLEFSVPSTYKKTNV